MENLAEVKREGFNVDQLTFADGIDALEEALNAFKWMQETAPHADGAIKECFVDMVRLMSGERIRDLKRKIKEMKECLPEERNS